AIGWEEMGDLSKIAADREALKKCHSLIYPNSKKQSAAIGVGIIYKFAHEVKIGDYVVFPSKIDKQINIGIVESDYYYESKAEWYNNRRKVKWIKHLPRTAFSQGALYVLGAQMTFFTVKSYIDEFISALNNDKTYIPDEDDSIGATAAEIKLSTKDFIIKELSKNLKGYDLENFVADLLEAMGYRTNVSQHGGDSGVDIIAYKDELPPRILVQVKSQDGDIKENTIQSLKGAMREGDYGVFVTLSDYTKNARKYLESTPIIRGINGDELTELILKYYNNLSEKYKEIIPLEMVYIPVAFEEEQ
nr:restriction endonuclease [Oscillospiraceae bacterium]